jgi:polyhydroxyalkanoate synthesis regulator phasin
MQVEGERLVARLRRDARSLATQSRQETVSGLLSEARRLQGDLRRRAERTIKDLEARRVRILSTLEQQATSLAERFAKSFNVATSTEVAEVGKRLGELGKRVGEFERHVRDLEHRLDALGKRVA